MEQPERLLHRDRLRNARYAALADAEGFQEVCYAIEALGMRLLGAEASMAEYEPKIRYVADSSPNLSSLPAQFPMYFTRFLALYDIVRRARNDAMHVGAYARHATTAAVELCIGLEEAVMATSNQPALASDLMVKTPVFVEPWQPVAHARQLMLAHSFSFLPLLHDRKWYLLSDMALVVFLRPMLSKDRKAALALPVREAVGKGLELLSAKTIGPTEEVSKLWANRRIQSVPSLWLVIERPKRLVGVLSPFELM